MEALRERGLSALPPLATLLLALAKSFLENPVDILAFYCQGEDGREVCKKRKCAKRKGMRVRAAS